MYRRRHALYQEETDTEEKKLSTEILLMLFLLMVALMGGSFLKKKGSHYLQEAGLTTLIGMLAGLCLKSVSVEVLTKELTDGFVDLFMLLLLPPIIFESGYNMAKNPFFRNFGTIMMFAFLGTFIAIFFSSFFFYSMAKLGLKPDFSFRECFAFGTLISSTDPVSVLATFKEMNADANLNAIIFGESIFNDAITIVMYRTIAAMEKPGNTSSVGQ